MCVVRGRVFMCESQPITYKNDTSPELKVQAINDSYIDTCSLNVKNPLLLYYLKIIFLNVY